MEPQDLLGVSTINKYYVTNVTTKKNKMVGRRVITSSPEFINLIIDLQTIYKKNAMEFFMGIQ